MITLFLQTIAVFKSYHLQWPNEVSLTFTALSLASFNLDLFAVSCYIPSASYAHKWIGTLLILPGGIKVATFADAIPFLAGRFMPRRLSDGRDIR